MNYFDALHNTWNLALAPAMLAAKYNSELWRTWMGSSASIDRELTVAQENVLALIQHTLENAEQALPTDLQQFSPLERNHYALRAVENAQSYMLAAIGELYKAARVITMEPGQVIEHDAVRHNLLPAKRS